MPRLHVENRPYVAQWRRVSLPGANAQATITEDAPAAGTRVVLQGFTASIANGATAPAAANVVVNVIDGASGGTTYLHRTTISNTATAGDTVVVTVSDLNIAGTAATALTVEFSAASGANTNQSISAWGYNTTD